MAKPNPMERKLYLKENVDEKSVMPLIEAIHRINDDDAEKEKEYNGWEREPIKLYIYTYGVVCYAGFALIDAIRASKTPVHTIVLGTAMSMGIFVFNAGHKRLIGEHATLMYHDVSISTGMNGEMTEGLKIELDEALRLQKMGSDFLMEYSLIEESVLKDYINRKADWYISAEEAIRLKIADAYYK
jgi:ATP-dependent Clp protease protease subunit